MKPARALYISILKNICEKEQITFTSFSGDWFFMLTRGGAKRFIFDHQFSLNDAAARALCDDKCAASDIFKYFNIPHVKHSYCGSAEAVSAFLIKHNTIVIKKNNGTGGKDVFRASNEREAAEAAAYLLARFGCFAVSPYYDIEAEYRVIILDGDAELVYEKIRDVNSNEWRHNLGLGAVPRIAAGDSRDFAQTVGLAKDAARAINARFVSADIVKSGGRLMALEVNAGVMMEHFAYESPEHCRIAEDIYTKAIRKMF